MMLRARVGSTCLMVDSPRLKSSHGYGNEENMSLEDTILTRGQGYLGFMRDAIQKSKVWELGFNMLYVHSKKQLVLPGYIVLSPNPSLFYSTS
jgi:hypothetical protein